MVIVVIVVVIIVVVFFVTATTAPTPYHGELLRLRPIQKTARLRTTTYDNVRRLPTIYKDLRRRMTDSSRRLWRSSYVVVVVVDYVVVYVAYYIVIYYVAVYVD